MCSERLYSRSCRGAASATPGEEAGRGKGVKEGGGEEVGKIRKARGVRELKEDNGGRKQEGKKRRR